MEKLPLISIIGVPNTGKSTLFNRLIGARKALIHALPGMTRDVYRKRLEIDGQLYHLQDTGGFFLDEQLITGEINKRVLAAAKRSDLVLFLFDGKREMLGYEKDLFLEIRKINKNIIPIVNKVDAPARYILPASYYELKLDFILISAEHNDGVEELLRAIPALLPGATAGSEEEIPPRISIIGKPNVGKSSLINCILKEEWAIVSPQPGTTRDSIDVQIRHGRRLIELVDNAGIRKLQKVKEDTESAAVLRAERDIRAADILVFVVDISRRMDQNDLFIARQVIESAKPVIIVANKWDLVTEKNRAEVHFKAIHSRFQGLYFAPILLISAVSGKNVFSIIERVEQIERKLREKPTPSQLLATVKRILAGRRLITEGNTVFNPKFAVVESTRPYFINFFTHTEHRLKPNEEIYLKKRLGEEFDLLGIPIFFKITRRQQRSARAGKIGESGV